MNDFYIFDPRDSRYKEPYGAVPSGASVSFSLRPHRNEGFSRGVLIARFEFRDDATFEIPLTWQGPDGNREVFSAVLNTGGYVGLVWYSFRLETPDGQSRTLGDYQLTVYDGSASVPAWFGEGLTYHIFPDRFRRTAVPDPDGMVGSRTVHQDWQDQPDYLPDATGEVRNRDFFGGSLAGILEKLDYLQSLGVETLYLCPIFEAAENHRYGTGDYEKIDPMLGTEEDFSALCEAAHARGMHVMLDGVFNHTGYVSKYFNGDGSYPTVGAAQSLSSPYASWFTFAHWPDKYASWWGIYSLPAVNENEPSYVNYIMGAESSVVRRWLRAGADGWRLDVADELPDTFIEKLRGAVRREKREAVVIGEVWEDGSTKVAYGVRRKHLLGGHCDGLMNYPFRNALLAFLLGGDAAAFRDTMETLRENYPKSAFYSAMNLLGTHDTPRILTLLGAGEDGGAHTKDWRGAFRLTPAQYALGAARLRLAALVMFAFPGSPTLYYGDEAGMQGFEDPFNRRTFPWGGEDQSLIRWFSCLGRARRSLPALRRGDIRYLKAQGRLLAFTRSLGGETVLAAVNAGDREESLLLPGGTPLLLPPMTGYLLPLPLTPPAQ